MSSVISEVNTWPKMVLLLQKKKKSQKNFSLELFIPLWLVSLLKTNSLTSKMAQLVNSLGINRDDPSSNPQGPTR